MQRPHLNHSQLSSFSVLPSFAFSRHCLQFAFALSLTVHGTTSASRSTIAYAHNNAQRTTQLNPPRVNDAHYTPEIGDKEATVLRYSFPFSCFPILPSSSLCPSPINSHTLSITVVDWMYITCSDNMKRFHALSSPRGLGGGRVGWDPVGFLIEKGAMLW